MKQEGKEISLKYLFLTFLKIGAISWGGFMALIAVVQKQLVDKDKVIREEVILDGISLASVLPGAVAINVVTYVGYQLRGFRGAIVSMIATIIPGFLLITGLGVIYSTYGELPIFSKFFLGILPAISAVILSVAIDMIKKQVKDLKQILVCFLAAICLLMVHSFWATLGTIIASAVFGYIFYRGPITNPEKSKPSVFTINYRKFFYYSCVGLFILLVVGALIILLGLDEFDWYKINRTIFFNFFRDELNPFWRGVCDYSSHAASHCRWISLDGYKRICRCHSHGTDHSWTCDSHCHIYRLSRSRISGSLRGLRSHFHSTRHGYVAVVWLSKEDQGLPGV